jgi:predicted enzyme related to lactoylglutathione lyase
MTARIVTISIAAQQPRVVADFWREALGWAETQADATGMTLAPPDGTGPIIEIGAVPDAKIAQNRLHLDLRADGTSTAEELQRLLALGARRTDIGQAPDAGWTVLCDPEGNEFCLLDRSVQAASER